MTPRRKRLLAVLAIVAGVGAATALATLAFQDNLLYFYNPTQVLAGRCAERPHVPDRRHGHRRQPQAHRRARSQIRFVVTDYQHSIPVRYEGLLPDLFREGQGVIAHGQMTASGEFVADEILAKHDENYMPPEVARIAAQPTPARVSRMIPELGHFALILALLLLGNARPLRPRRRRRAGTTRWMAAGRSAVAGQFVFVALAFGALRLAFIERDFSVLYVASEFALAAAALLPRSPRSGARTRARCCCGRCASAGWTLAVTGCERLASRRRSAAA